MFDFITRTLEQTGYVGVALLMFLENVFPPIPSEVIMPLAGYTATQGEMNIILVWLAGSTGETARVPPRTLTRPRLRGGPGWHSIPRFGEGRTAATRARRGG